MSTDVNSPPRGYLAYRRQQGFERLTRRAKRECAPLLATVATNLLRASLRSGRFGIRASPLKC